MLSELQKEIILAYAGHNMSISKVGNNSYRHRNTINYHLRQVHEKTGLNPRKFYDLVELINIILEEKHAIHSDDPGNNSTPSDNHLSVDNSLS